MQNNFKEKKKKFCQDFNQLKKSKDFVRLQRKKQTNKQTYRHFVHFFFDNQQH